MNQTRLTTHEASLIKLHPILQFFPNVGVYLIDLFETDAEVANQLSYVDIQNTPINTDEAYIKLNGYLTLVLTCIAKPLNSQLMIKMTEELLKLGFDFTTTRTFVVRACYWGDLEWLRWWVSSGVPFVYDEEAIKWLCYKERINILEWWIQSGLDFKYDKTAIKASIQGESPVLKWWLQSGYPIKYDKEIIRELLNNNNPKLLDMWLKSGLTFGEIDVETGVHLSARNAYHTLQYIIDNKIPFEYDERLIDWASQHGRIK